MIVVTGMHRSGTSLVCQLLEALGVPFGDRAEHLPADRWNAAGYFERTAVVDLNSRIVTGFPRSRSRLAKWASRLVYLVRPRPGAIARRAVRHRAALGELADALRGEAVKDPRFCLTLPFWLAVAEVEHVVVCLRDPGAVVASIVRRDRVPQWLAARFYAWHVDSLLRHLPRERAAFVDVDRLAAGEAGELDALRTALGLGAGEPSAAVLARVVRPKAWHAREARPCPPRALAAWQRLASAAAVRGR